MMSFRAAIALEKPLQIVGVVNAYVALMAKRAGYKAIYLSGAGVANMSYGLPDLGLTTASDVLEDVSRITSVVDVPLLVDIDTGWGGERVIERCIKALMKAGASAIHIEDQVTEKRCGHRPGKALVSTEEMVARIRAAVAARGSADFTIMARTDALAVEGLDKALARAQAYREAGADMLFPEAVTRLEDYRRFRDVSEMPVLANMTEFGKTPLFTRDELAGVGVDMILYPLSVTRAMNHAAEHVLQEIRHKGTQQDVVAMMQTRDALYEVLDYWKEEERIDRMRGGGNG